MLADISKDKTLLLLVTGTVLAIAYPIFIANWHDISRSYTITPDADLVYLAQALRFVDSLPQTYFDHPAHTYIMGLGMWLKAAFWIGLSPNPSHAFAIQVQDIDSHLQALTVSARYLSAVICACFVGLVIWGTKQLTSNLTFAVLAGILFASMEGIASHAVILRAELWSAFGLVAAFFFFLVADQSYGRKQLLYLTLAGFSVMVSLESKIQSIIPMLGVPILVLAQVQRERLKSDYMKLDRMAAPLFFAVAAIIPMFVLLAFAVRDGSSTSFGGVFLCLNLVYVTTCILLYGYWRNISVSVQLAGAVALALGFAFGTYLLFFWHSHQVLDLIVHSFEHMKQFSSLSGEQGLSMTYASDKLFSVIDRRIGDIPSPTHLLQLSGLFLACYLSFHKAWRGGLLVLLFLGFSLATETVFGLRGFPSRYLIYTEIWVILALLIGGSKLLQKTSIGNRRLCFLLLALVIALNVNVGLGASIVPIQPKSHICGQAQGYLEPELANRVQHHCN